jgi:hypothetical protein
MDRPDLINIQSDKANEKEVPRNGALIDAADGVSETQGASLHRFFLSCYTSIVTWSVTLVLSSSTVSKRIIIPPLRRHTDY